MSSRKQVQKSRPTASKSTTSRKSVKASEVAKSRSVKTVKSRAQTRKHMDVYERKDVYDYESVEGELQEVRASIGAALNLALVSIKDQFRRFLGPSNEVRKAGLTLLVAYFKVFDTIQQYLPPNAEAARTYCNGIEYMNLQPSDAEAMEKMIIEDFLRRKRPEAKRLFSELFNAVHAMQARLDEIDGEIDPADEELWITAKSFIDANDERDHTHMEFMKEFKYYVDIPSYM